MNVPFFWDCDNVDVNSAALRKTKWSACATEITWNEQRELTTSGMILCWFYVEQGTNFAAAQCFAFLNQEAVGEQDTLEDKGHEWMMQDCKEKHKKLYILSKKSWKAARKVL